ncbi:MAG: hypothetical protein V3U11_03760, partial [Planctomycetota bacterium]
MESAIWSAMVTALLSLQVAAVPAQSAAELKSTSQPAKAQPPSRQDLAKILAKNHQTGASVPKVLGFGARLEVTSLGRKNDNITVVIDSKFCKAVATGGSSSSNFMEMIRYTLDEGGKRLERGRDAKGYWFRADDKVKPLEDRDSAQDRRLIRREIRLAKQLLSVLDPANVVRQLRGKVTVREA